MSQRTKARRESLDGFLTWTRRHDTTVEHGLRAIERGLLDKRLAERPKAPPGFSAPKQLARRALLL
ncbi:MAG TPA: hypothetical protein VK565_10160 [Gemmatimonadaceae bacterium]|nr:hypothetical protein [Gemmatimonadaceae bacterium]